MKYYSLLAIMVVITIVSACVKANISKVPDSIKKPFTVSIAVKNNQLNLLAGDDTATINITINSPYQGASYIITASDTTMYDGAPVLPNDTIVKNAQVAVNYAVGYASKVPNSMKVLTFTVTENNGTSVQEKVTFNVTTGFAVNIAPTSQSILFGNRDSLVISITTDGTLSGSYTIGFSDTVYYQSMQYAPNTPITLRNPKTDTLTYLAITAPFNARANQLSYSATYTSVDKPQIGNVTINLLNNSFTPVITPKQNDIYIGFFDTVTIAISNSVNLNTTYSLQIDSAFTYKGVAYAAGSRIMLQNIRGNNGLDSIVFKGNVSGAFAPTLTIKNSLIDSNITIQTQKLQLTVVNNSFTPVITPNQTNIYRGGFDTTTIAMTNAVNPNTTYSLRIDSAFIYKGVAYAAGSRVVLQNIRGNNGLDSIVFKGNLLGAFAPTLTIKNQFVDSNTTVQTQKLQLNVINSLTLVSPANGATNQPVQPIFVWENVNPAITSYALYYGTNPNNLTRDTRNYTDNTNLSDTVRVSPDGLASPYLNYATQYYWKIVGINTSGERVDSLTSSFTVRNAINLNMARASFGLVSYNDIPLYAIGGVETNPLRSVESFNGISTWTNTVSDLNIPRSYFGTVVYNDSIYAVGGFDGSAYTDSVETFNNTATGWQKSTQTLNTRREGLGVAVYNDSIYAVGGYDGISDFNNVEVFSTATGWQNSAQTLNTARRNFGLVVYNGNLYAIGGYNGSYLSSVEVFNTASGWQTAIQTLNTARFGFGVVTYNNNIYVVGGFAAGPSLLNSVEFFNGNSWQYCTPMPTARTGLSFAEYNGLLYAVGGYDGFNSSNAFSIVEIYNPATNQWQ
ncbi:MAG: hypothetical protein QM528_01060 [Phycisphaerales bacterium]|nr:hypothetical protein [Phycisphaerales bacterium]